MAQHSYFDQLAAAGAVANIMAGTPFETLPTRCGVRIYGASYTNDPGTGRLDVIVGQTMLTTPDGAALPTLAAIGQGPDKNRHKILDEVVAGGQPLVIRLRNTDAVNALDPTIIIDLTFF